MGTRWKLVVLALLAMLSSEGCSTMNNTESGALGGGLIGAGIGALAGGHKHALEGAVAGGAIGTGVGALAGHSADQDEKRRQEAIAAANAPVNGPLSFEQIVQMSKAGVGDPLIINQIRASRTSYNLDADMIIWLQQNGVSNAVITEMQNTSRYGVRPVYIREGAPIVYERPVYVAPPPVGFSFGYTRVIR
jgi:hypothetical protein